VRSATGFVLSLYQLLPTSNTLPSLLYHHNQTDARFQRFSKERAQEGRTRQVCRCTCEERRASLDYIHPPVNGRWQAAASHDASYGGLQGPRSPQQRHVAVPNDFGQVEVLFFPGGVDDPAQRRTRPSSR
jgi:hypothetical protein